MSAPAVSLAGCAGSVWISVNGKPAAGGRSWRARLSASTTSTGMVPTTYRDLTPEERTVCASLGPGSLVKHHGQPAPAARSARACGAGKEAGDETYEDQINRVMESRKLLPNASYFAFTATPKNKTREISGEPEFGGRKVTEASLDGFPSGQIAEKIQEDPYRFLVCAEKFQTGQVRPSRRRQRHRGGRSRPQRIIFIARSGIERIESIVRSRIQSAP